MSQYSTTAGSKTELAFNRRNSENSYTKNNFCLKHSIRSTRPCSARFLSLASAAPTLSDYKQTSAPINTGRKRQPTKSRPDPLKQHSGAPEMRLFWETVPQSLSKQQEGKKGEEKCKRISKGEAEPTSNWSPMKRTGKPVSLQCCDPFRECWCESWHSPRTFFPVARLLWPPTELALCHFYTRRVNIKMNARHGRTPIFRESEFGGSSPGTTNTERRLTYSCNAKISHILLSLCSKPGLNHLQQWLSG